MSAKHSRVHSSTTTRMRMRRIGIPPVAAQNRELLRGRQFERVTLRLYQHGIYTREAIAERRQLGELMRQSRVLASRSRSGQPDFGAKGRKLEAVHARLFLLITAWAPIVLMVLWLPRNSLT